MAIMVGLRWLSYNNSRVGRLEAGCCANERLGNEAVTQPVRNSEVIRLDA